MNQNIIDVLISMGYREMDKNVYGKPVGFSLYTFDKHQDNWELTHWFTGVKTKKAIRWSSVKIDISLPKPELLIKFQHAENDIGHTHFTYGDYSFSSISEQLANLS